MNGLQHQAVPNADAPGGLMSSDTDVRIERKSPSSNSSVFMAVPMRREVWAAIDTMRQDLGHQWSIAELARIAHVSGSHLMRLFTEEIGLAPISWLARERVQEMARLLRETSLSILEIARQVGWRDRGHASDQFKRFTGFTPSQYRFRQREVQERHCLWCGQPIPPDDTRVEVGDHRNAMGDLII